MDRFVNLLLASNGDGSAASPWNKMPQTTDGAAAGNTVAAGDVVHVQVGTTCTQQITHGISNVTYRGWTGYGTAPALQVRQRGLVPGTSLLRRVGNGMWRIDVRGTADADGMSLSGATRAGITIEDVHVMGTAGTGRGMRFGNTATTGRRVAVRRSLVENTPFNAVAVYSLDFLLEDSVIRRSAQDGVVIYPTAANGYRAGSWDVVRWCEFDDPGYDPGLPGDACQYAGETGLQAGNFAFYGNHVRRTTSNKQAVLLSGQGYQLCFDNHLEGDDPTEQTQAGILTNSLRGYAYIGRNVIKNSYQQGIRFADSMGSAGLAAYSVGQNASIDIEDNLLLGKNQYFLRLGNTQHGAGSRVRVRRNRVLGELALGFYVGLNGATYEAGSIFRSEDNACLATLGAGWAYDFGGNSVAGDIFEFVRDRMPAGALVRSGNASYAIAAFAAHQNAGKSAGSAPCDVRTLDAAQAVWDEVGRFGSSSDLWRGGDFDRHRLDVYGDLHTVPRWGGRIPF